MNPGQITSVPTNTALGKNALEYAINHPTIGNDNTAYGYDALSSLRAGKNESSAFGSGALRYSTEGENSAFGAHAAATLNTESGNAAFGNWALRYVAGSENSAFGHRSSAGNALTTPNGNYNSSFGAHSMLNPSGNNNSAFGHKSLHSIDTGSDNTALGKDAGKTLTNGSNNIFIGSGANTSDPAGNYRTVIGAGVIATQDNTVVLGRATDRVGIRTTNPDTALHVVGSSAENAIHAESINPSTSFASGAGVAIHVDGGHRNKVTYKAYTASLTSYSAKVDDYIIIIGSLAAITIDYDVVLPLPTEDGHTYIIRNAVEVSTATNLVVHCTSDPLVFVTVSSDYTAPVASASVPVGESRTYVSINGKYVSI